MRRIDIPKEAIDRHEKTLGTVILSFLNRLAEGQRVTWEVHASGGKTHDQVCRECERIVDKILDERYRQYWIWVRNEFRDYHILTASPAKLFSFVRENELKIKKLSASKEDVHAIEMVCHKLLNYPAFRSGKVLLSDRGSGKILWAEKEDSDDEYRGKAFKKWGNWCITEFVRLLDVRYCPYCNAETVGTAHLPSSEYVPDIDHILPKGVYPLLSLSLYNLVPVCNRCNSRFKKEYDMLKGWNGQSDLPALHPYVHHIYKHIRFDYNPTSVNNLYLKPHSFDATYVSPLTISAVKDSKKIQKRAEDYIMHYHLKEIYNDLYSEEINESIKIEALCSPIFVESMKRLYGVAENDFDQLFRRTSLDPREINHCRFAKLIGDLHDTICFEDSDQNRERIIGKLKDRFGLRI